MHLYKANWTDTDGNEREETVSGSDTMDVREATGQQGGTVKEIGEALLTITDSRIL